MNTNTALCKSFPLPLFCYSWVKWAKIYDIIQVLCLYTKMINLMTQGCFIILYLQFYNHSILSSIQLRYVLIVILIIFTGKNNYWFFGLLSLKLKLYVLVQLRHGCQLFIYIYMTVWYMIKIKWVINSITTSNNIFFCY